MNTALRIALLAIVLAALYAFVAGRMEEVHALLTYVAGVEARAWRMPALLVEIVVGLVVMAAAVVVGQRVLTRWTGHVPRFGWWVSILFLSPLAVVLFAFKSFAQLFLTIMLLDISGWWDHNTRYLTVYVLDDWIPVAIIALAILVGHRLMARARRDAEPQDE